MRDPSYEAFLTDIEALVADDAKFHKVVLTDGQTILRGEVPIIDKVDGRVWEKYTVEIHHRPGYPNRFPAVYEVSGKIPQLADWHVNADKSCCIAVWPEELLKCSSGLDLRRFLDEEVCPYFYNQTHRKIEGYYVNGERGHGAQGILEFYSRELGTKLHSKKTAHLLRFIAKKPRPGRSTYCFCGGGKKFRKCHRSAYDKLWKIGAENLLEHAELISAELS